MKKPARPMSESFTSGRPTEGLRSIVWQCSTASSRMSQASTATRRKGALNVRVELRKKQGAKFCKIACSHEKRLVLVAKGDSEMVALGINYRVHTYRPWQSAMWCKVTPA